MKTYLVIFFFFTLYSHNSFSLTFGNWNIGPKVGFFYGEASNDQNFTGYSLGPSINYKFGKSTLGIDALFTNYLDFSSNRFNEGDFRGTDFGLVYTYEVTKYGSLYFGVAPNTRLASKDPVQLSDGTIVDEMKLRGNVIRLGYLLSVFSNAFKVGFIYNYHEYENITSGLEGNEGEAHFWHFILFF